MEEELELPEVESAYADDEIEDLAKDDPGLHDEVETGENAPDLDDSDESPAPPRSVDKTSMSVPEDARKERENR